MGATRRWCEPLRRPAVLKNTNVLPLVGGTFSLYLCVMSIPPSLNPKSIQINWRWFFGKNLELSYKIQSLRPLHIEVDLMAHNGVRISSKATSVKTNIAKYQRFDVLANGFTWFGYSKKSRTSSNWTLHLPWWYANPYGDLPFWNDQCHAPSWVGHFIIH